MSLTVLGSNSGGGYNLESSLRFRSSAGAYLNRTPASAGNRTTWTWSGWFKRGKIDSGGSQYFLFSGYTASTDAGYTAIYISGDQLSLSGWNTAYRKTTQVFRDPSAWYHLVIVWDSSQGTASNRIKIYVNGIQITAFATSNDPTSSQTSGVNAAGVHTVGVNTNTLGANPFDGYMTEVNFVDGQALAPTEFGEYDDITGVWKPKKYTGTYGTNGFYLKNCRGTDQSGNGNNFTENNFNTTGSSVNYDIMNDVPTLTDEDTANYATYNPLSPLSASTVVDNGNIRLVNSGTSAWRHAVSSIALPNTGKWYFEMTASVDSNNGTMGLAPVESLANGSNGYVTDAILTNTPNADGVAAGGLTGSTGPWTGTYNINALEALACAVDMDANKVWFRIGSNWVDAGSGAGDPSAGTNPAVSGGINSSKTYHFVTGAYAQNHYVNFGQRPFAYTVPTGFKKLNTYNLPDSTIKDGSQYFNTVTYTGNGSTQSITGVGFSPDLLWGKSRSASYFHNITDTVRGLTKYLDSSNSYYTSEFTKTDKVTAVTSDGFTLGADTSTDGSVNISGQSQVMWCWRGSDSSPVTNTDGTITSTISANPNSGFSVVTYTGNATSGATVGHGLGVSPAMMIVKNRDAAQYWIVQHQSLSAITYNLYLQTADSQQPDSQFTGKSATTVTLNGGSVNTNGNKYVMYAFAEVEGYSKFGSYTGNGSADGPFIYTGFRSKYIMFKKYNGAGGWIIFDTARSTYNPVPLNGGFLIANLTNAEAGTGDSAAYFDILSNGIKIRNISSFDNDSGGTYIYMAFAKNPFKNSLAR